MTDHTDERPDASRRRLLQAGVGAAAFGALPGAGILAARAQGAFDWKRFKGEKIEIFLVKSPRGDLLTKYHKEFEDLTGITVGSEMIDAAAKLNEPGKGIAGFVGRGLKNANVPVWTSFLLGYGGAFIDAKGKLLTDSNEAIEAGKMYQTLLGKHGPPGVAGFNWNEAQSLFLQGKAAMWLDGIGFAQPLEDPTKSRIVGKVGYGVMPAGPKQQVSALFGDGEGISTYSRKKGPAWVYLP